MSAAYWSWLLTLCGVTTFWLAGRKVWWCWYIGLGTQALWLAYSLVTAQYGFLVGCALYTSIYAKNAIKWTRERKA